MNTCFLIVKKDLAHLKAWLVVWLALILFQTTLSLVGIHWATHNYYFQMLYPYIIHITQGLQALLMIVAVPLLIHEDALVGTRAFWMTRPISRGTLLAAKLCFVCPILILLPLISEIFVLKAHAFGFHQILLAIPEIVMEQCFFLVPLMILASLTIRFSQFALIGAILFVGLTVFAIGTSFVPGSLDLSARVVIQLMTIVLGLGLLIHQYLTRSARRSVIGLVICFVLVLVTGHVGRWDFLKERQAQSLKHNVAPGIKVVTDINHVVITDNPQLRAKDERTKSIRAKQTIIGLPEGQFAILQDMKNIRMSYRGGETVYSRPMQLSRRESYDLQKFTGPLQTALEEYQLVNASHRKFMYTEIYNISEEKFNLYKGAVGQYDSTAQYGIYKYQITGAVPLQKHEKILSDSNQVIIFDILERPAGITVLIEEKEGNLVFDRTQPYRKMIRDADSFEHVYVLCNTKRKEALLPQPSPTVTLNGVNVLSPFSKRLWHTMKQLDFVAIDDRNEGLPVINSEWLRDAELVQLHVEKIGTQEKHIRYQRFYLPAQSSELPNGESQHFDPQLKLWERGFWGR